MSTDEPTHDRALAERVARVYLAQRRLGCEIAHRDGLSLATRLATPLIYDANFAFDVDPALAADPRAFTDAVSAAFDGLGHQKVVCDADVEPIVEARLAAEGFAAEAVLQLVLERSLTRAARLPDDVTLTPAESEADWAALVELKHADFEESAAKAGRPPLERAVAEQMIETWRAKTGMHFWLGRAGGEPCAYLGAWAGHEELGMLEYLFTLPAQRHRGIATALIDRAVDAVRAEGAGAVLIGAAVDDTPRQMYVDLGFRPVCLTREWLRVDPVGPA